MLPSASARRARLRQVLAWLGTLAVITVYFSLPDGEERLRLAGSRPSKALEADPPTRIEVVGVTPSEASPGSAVTVDFAGAKDAAAVQAFVGKAPLEVLSRLEDSLVVRLPAELVPGHVKVRVTDGGERSKPYDLRVKAENWRKPFRSLIGGFALLLFGISVLSRGAREAVGLSITHRLARLARRGPAALGMGVGLGALAQSTTAAAGVLAGLVGSSLLGLAPAAAAFLGAQIGAASAPLVTGLFDPREGLLLVALGVMWLGLASNRRAAALARLCLGAGLIAFGLQTLRPGFEPFVQDPALLTLVGKFRATGWLEVAGCALLGAGLVAVFQGPAPVVVLVLVLAQTTAQWDLRTALAVLSGSGLGAALGAMLTTAVSASSRKLAGLNLVLGLGSTLLAACSVDFFTYLADWVVPGIPHELRWGKRVLLPNLGLHLGVAFGMSQLACALTLLPAVAPIARAFERWFPRDRPSAVPSVGDAARVTQAGLLTLSELQLDTLAPLRELALEGDRAAGRRIEANLAEAHDLLEELVTGPVAALAKTSRSRALGSAVLTSVQLQRSLENLHRQAERFLDARVALSSNGQAVVLSESDLAAIEQMHGHLSAGRKALLAALREQQPIDVESARAREMSMNGLEAQLRKSLLEGDRDSVRSHLAVLKLADAYEGAGNQLYRLCEALEEGLAKAAVAEADAV